MHVKRINSLLTNRRFYPNHTLKVYKSIFYLEGFDLYWQVEILMFLYFKINEINQIYVGIIQILIGKYFNIIFTNQINENKLKITL